MSYPPQDEYEQQPQSNQGQPQQGWGSPQGYPQEPYPQQAYPPQGFPQQGVPGQPLGYAGMTAAPRDNSGRAKAAFVLLLVAAALAAVQVLIGVASTLLIDYETMLELQNPDPASPLPGGRVLAVLGAAFCFGLLFLVLWIIAYIFYLMWQHRAFFNARATGQQTSFSPGWSVGWWFIPFANLVAIGLVLRDLWKATAGRGEGGGLPTILWILILLYFVLAVTSAIMNFIAMEQENRPLYYAAAAIGIGNSLLIVAFLALLAMFVRRVQVAQAG